MLLCIPDGLQKVSLSELLVFWTGADAVPPMGFMKDLSVEFYPKVPGERRLPSASTCALCLWLPRGVVDEDEMGQLMSDAVMLSAGFGKI